MQIRVLLPTILIVLAVAVAPRTLLAQGTGQQQPAQATSGSETDAAGQSEAPDEDLESVYQDDDDPGDIEVITVRAEESDAASDFETGDSVAAFDASDLDALGAQSIADLATFTPNLEIVTSGATTPTFFIRGVGLNDFNANSSGAVAIYQNDVPKNSPALQLGTLFDIENVNILRRQHFARSPGSRDLSQRIGRCDQDLFQEADRQLQRLFPIYTWKLQRSRSRRCGRGTRLRRHSRGTDRLPVQ
ncbi:MAG: Plug domain-containing protein [Deltaproteobacteria bacterium]|nr:Plug domain-containing protein [Deltaproteobacteria bacterium]